MVCLTFCVFGIYLAFVKGVRGSFSVLCNISCFNKREKDLLRGNACIMQVIAGINLLCKHSKSYLQTACCCLINNSNHWPIVVMEDKDFRMCCCNKGIKFRVIMTPLHHATQSLIIFLWQEQGIWFILYFQNLDNSPSWVSTELNSVANVSIPVPIGSSVPLPSSKATENPVVRHSVGVGWDFLF